MELGQTLFLLFGCLVACNGGVVSTLPARCAAVLCLRDDRCPNPITPPGECCPICTMDCRVVRCASPPTNCETIIPGGGCCPVCRQDTKPGTCPQPGIGVCASLCSSDQQCNGKQKCCSNGCGHQCMNPITRNPQCFGVRCSPIPANCRRTFLPPGRCCPICAGYRRRSYGRDRD